MRNTILLILLTLISMHIIVKSDAQTYANTSLSNLTSPTAVNQALSPGKNAQHNLGSSTKSWLNLYLSKKIYFNNVLGIYIHGTDDFFAGPNAGNLTYTGLYNLGIGSHTLHQVTSGSGNTATGWKALFYDSSGNNNTALGGTALYANTNGSNNTAVGVSALYTNRTGSDNIAVGVSALSANDAGNDNVAVGNDALANNNGNENIAIGYSLQANTSGHDNVGVGFLALLNNTIGNYNVASGYEALQQNSSGNDNTASGAGALAGNVGSDNTATGSNALTSNTYGGYNSANGIGALFTNSTGNYNTADGAEAGGNVTDGSYNTFIGYYANCGSGGHLTNSTAIGNGASVTTNNKVVIGNTSVSSIGGYANWTNFSDGRYKQNIKQNVPGLAFINKLTPITYTLNINAIERKLHEGEKEVTTKDGKTLPNPMNDPIIKQAMNEKSKIIYTGFVAQNVEKAAESLNYDFSGVDKPKDDQKSFYGLRYSDFVVPLVKAVQELSKQNDSLKNDNEEMKLEIGNLKSEMENIKTILLSNKLSANNQQAANSSSLGGGWVEASPNPFSNSTMISYSIPQKFTSAEIIITDKNGNALKTITLTNNKGSVNINATTFSSGAYQYSLYIDGRLIATKQMILSK